MAMYELACTWTLAELAWRSLRRPAPGELPQITPFYHESYKHQRATPGQLQLPARA